MASNERRLRLASLVPLLLILFAVLAPIAPAGAAGLTVAKQTATVDFPTKLTFDLVADAPQAVSAAEVWYHPAYDPVTSVSRPKFSGGTHVDVSTSVDMQLNYVWPGVDMVYHWRLTLKDGSILTTPEQTFLYMDSRYQWSTATSGAVTVYYQKGDDQIGQEALKTTVGAINQFQQTFHLTSSEPVHVVVYGSDTAFASALPPNSAEWIGGVAEPYLHLVLTAIQPGSDAMSETHRILSHEVVHLSIYQATSNPFNSPPPWLDEGLATYYQEVQDSRFKPMLQTAVKSGTLIPVRALNSSFPDDPNQALLSYAESESVVDFIINQKGADKMSALLQAFKGGVSYDQAVQAGLGISLDQLDKEWKDWLGYKGDKPVSATVDAARGDAGTGQHNRDQLVASASAILVGVAAILCLVAGAAYALRSRTTRNQTL